MCGETTWSDFQADMIECARENEAFMLGKDTEQQSKFMLDKVRFSDSSFALFPDKDGGYTFYVLSGADVLDGAGFDLAVVEQHGNPPRPRPRRLHRPIRATAFFVKDYMGARFLEICFGDSAYARKMRKTQEADGGKQAISNMRESVTPAGRARLAGLGFSHHGVH